LTFSTLILAIIFLSTTNFLEINFGIEIIELYIQLLIVCILLMLPLILIFLKNFKQKDDNFFLATLREKIEKINKDCKKRKNNL
jgi:ABC-type sulfate transport system permease subunit